MSTRETEPTSTIDAADPFGDSDDEARSCAPDDAECEFDDWLAEAEVSTEPDAPALRATTLAPERPIASADVLARVYNRLGGSMEALAAEHGIDVAAVLAVFRVECGPFAAKPLEPGRAIIRFENHLLARSAWGRANRAAYAAHFKHGSGKPWLGHEFRATTAEPWGALHVNQKREYAALQAATALAGEDTALRCISIGGCQILVRNFALIGYESPAAMYAAFQNDEGSHVRGFFAFCAAKALLEPLREKRWKDFARGFNGPGQVELYGPKIGDGYTSASKLIASRG